MEQVKLRKTQETLRQYTTESTVCMACEIRNPTLWSADGDAHSYARHLHPRMIRVLEQRPFILDMEACHMPRARRSFAEQWAHPTADPMVVRTSDKPTESQDHFPGADELSRIHPSSSRVSSVYRKRMSGGEYRTRQASPGQAP